MSQPSGRTTLAVICGWWTRDAGYGTICLKPPAASFPMGSQKTPPILPLCAIARHGVTFVRSERRLSWRNPRSAACANGLAWHWAITDARAEELGPPKLVNPMHLLWLTREIIIKQERRTLDRPWDGEYKA
ncbi:hypothetical protein BOTBODRAFT_636248 [Botryobasidium botryosum FD-172 SS1]|uniref:Uncharacterized protein n=1 Tax=Botryobasidium botryosum (strain FD-172 SS1) TaxID=930990 RepID=A0A067MXJ0_BOTB1|nr:hypothetical protein BOTBODRAFT_636248 [Botryobasidium botryosum FD-172 SS1]